MRDKNYNAKGEFGKRARVYREHFNLNQEDLATLMDILQPDYSEIESAKKSIGLDRAQLVATVYGIKYYSMADPNYPIPQFDQLPIATQNAISIRKEVGLNPRDYNVNLADNLNNVLNSDFLNTPHTAEEIWAQLPEEVRNKVEPRRITDLLGKSPRNSIIQKIPASAGEGKKNRYILKK
ncbi:helix-turn-helix transcriptional regulator [Pedobacter sp. B4-66]|uniref:helix-turn-helix domain-containing protein n=1 Tax=Pedobacter sp. B4-66 TaxID=2817280 RepID=UPI001BD9FA71